MVECYCGYMGELLSADSTAGESNCVACQAYSGC